MTLPIPYSYRTYDGNGTTDVFAVPFPYIVKPHVRVYLNWNPNTAVFESELAPGVGFDWAGDTSVNLVVPPPLGKTVSVVRITPIDQRVTQWQAGSPPTAFELTAADQQVLFVVQEFIDRVIITQGAVNLLSGGAPLVQVIDNLISTSQTSALSANQGRALKALIDAIDAVVDGLVADGSGPAVVDGLTSTDAAAALSANQGRVLKNLIDGVVAGNITSVGGVSSALLNTLAVDDPNTPVGTIVWLQRNPLTPPDGWLHCNGVDKQRAQYAQLFNAIGTTYGNGDGTTTFGFPLQANLTNPFAPDASYFPFIRFGARLSEPGELFVKYSTGDQLSAAFVDGLTVGTAITISGATGMQTANGMGPSISTDALIVSNASNNTTGRNVYIWKRSGSSFSLVNASPALAGTGNTKAVAVSPDGNYVAVLTSAPNNVLYIYKADAAKNNYTQIQSLTLSGPLTSSISNTAIRWSRSGSFLCLWENLFPPYRLIARSGDTFTEATSYPALSPTFSSLRAVEFDPTDNYVLLVTDTVAHIIARSGSAYVAVASYSCSGARNGFWSAAGNRIVISTTASPLLVLAFNGTTLSLAASNATQSDRLVPVRRVPGRFYIRELSTFTNELWSFAGDTLTNLGTPSPAFFSGSSTGMSSGQTVD